MVIKEVLYTKQQWTYGLDENGELIGMNIGPDGKPRFYIMTLGAYGQPILVEEPVLGLPAPEFRYINRNDDELARPSDLIVGLVVKNSARNTIHRFSLSNAEKSGISVDIGGNEVVVTTADGSRSYYLRALYDPNKNRTKGLVAFCGTEPYYDGIARIEVTDSDSGVAILLAELEDVDF